MAKKPPPSTGRPLPKGFHRGDATPIKVQPVTGPVQTPPPLRLPTATPTTPAHPPRPPPSALPKPAEATPTPPTTKHPLPQPALQVLRPSRFAQSLVQEMQMVILASRHGQPLTPLHK